MGQPEDGGDLVEYTVPSIIQAAYRNCLKLKKDPLEKQYQEKKVTLLNQITSLSLEDLKKINSKNPALLQNILKNDLTPKEVKENILRIHQEEFNCAKNISINPLNYNQYCDTLLKAISYDIDNKVHQQGYDILINLNDLSLPLARIKQENNALYIKTLNKLKEKSASYSTSFRTLKENLIDLKKIDTFMGSDNVIVRLDPDVFGDVIEVITE
jgi:hypothetical protein